MEWNNIGIVFPHCLLRTSEKDGRAVAARINLRDPTI